MESFDAVIVGAGPAGLTAATYLGRYRRRTLVLDGGPSRASWIPQSHNTPGFPNGVGGRELLARMTSQAKSYGAEIRSGWVNALNCGADALQFRVDDQSVAGRFGVLATGVVDRKPDIAGLDDAIRRGVVRICPICDAYEAIDQTIGVLGDSEHSVQEALFLRHYSARVTLIFLGGAPPAPQRLVDQGVAWTTAQLGDITLQSDGVQISRSGAGAWTFERLYLALGTQPVVDLALAAGAARDPSGALSVDGHQKTSVSRLYAAGDVVRGLNQIVVGAAEAAIAATDIHNRLRAE